MKWLNKLKCRLNFHDWEYYYKEIYLYRMYSHEGRPVTRSVEHRVCRRCMKTQRENMMPRGYSTVKPTLFTRGGIIRINGSDPWVNTVTRDFERG